MKSLHLLGRNLALRTTFQMLRSIFLLISFCPYHSIYWMLRFYNVIPFFILLQRPKKSVWKHSRIIKYLTNNWWLLRDSWAHMYCAEKPVGLLSMEHCCEKRIVWEIYMGFVSSFLCYLCPLGRESKDQYRVFTQNLSENECSSVYITHV